MKVRPILSGLASAVVVIMAMEFLSSKIYPVPSGMNLRDPAALKLYVNSLPITASLLLLAGNALAAFVGGMVIKKAAKNNKTLPAIILGILLTVFAFFNLISIPHPLWFAIINLLVYIPFALIGHNLIKND